ncbi:MAG TPA: hypothetical protein ENI61_02820 [Ignavibacteria bacterium]|nr:hypothetical protein [Ignavibacteria bacterium]
MSEKNSRNHWSIKDGDYERKETNEVDFKLIKKQKSRKRKAIYSVLAIISIIIEIFILKVVAKI